MTIIITEQLRPVIVPKEPAKARPAAQTGRKYAPMGTLPAALVKAWIAIEQVRLGVLLNQADAPAVVAEASVVEEPTNSVPVSQPPSEPQKPAVPEGKPSVPEQTKIRKNIDLLLAAQTTKGKTKTALIGALNSVIAGGLGVGFSEGILLNLIPGGFATSFGTACLILDLACAAALALPVLIATIVSRSTKHAANQLLKTDETVRSAEIAKLLGEQQSTITDWVEDAAITQRIKFTFAEIMKISDALYPAYACIAPQLRETKNKEIKTTINALIYFAGLRPTYGWIDASDLGTFLSAKTEITDEARTQIMSALGRLGIININNHGEIQEEFYRLKPLEFVKKFRQALSNANSLTDKQIYLVYNCLKALRGYNPTGRILAQTIPAGIVMMSSGFGLLGSLVLGFLGQISYPLLGMGSALCLGTGLLSSAVIFSLKSRLCARLKKLLKNEEYATNIKNYVETLPDKSREGLLRLIPAIKEPALDKPQLTEGTEPAPTPQPQETTAIQPATAKTPPALIALAGESTDSIQFRARLINEPEKTLEEIDLAQAPITALSKQAVLNRLFAIGLAQPDLQARVIRALNIIKRIPDPTKEEN